ncbi:MAG: hypothetical protein HY548_09955, partial [Elusimicrobia bacterium]|nr:hypothetical protein [Elusimicrobiota bacterium]
MLKKSDNDKGFGTGLLASLHNDLLTPRLTFAPRAVSPRRVRLAKKAFSAGLAVVYILTICPGHPSAWADLYDFIGSGRPRNNDNRNRSGSYAPEQLKEYLDYKERLVKHINQTQDMLRNGTGKNPAQARIDENLNKNLQTTQETVESLQRQAQDARQKVFNILGQNALFNYVKYEDGKVIRFMDGLAKTVENERILDAHGNVSRRNTFDMEYNQKKLLTAYKSDTTDSLSNTVRVTWSGGSYTADSVYYATDDTKANRLLVGYVQATTDPHGNVTQVNWSGAVYDDKILTGYHQISLDARGNKSTKDQLNLKYDANKQMVSFDEVETDALGNVRTKHWSGGTYVKNPAFSEDLKKRNISQEAAEYLLVGYHEEVVDDCASEKCRGGAAADNLKTSKDWTGATYDEFGQLTSYRETNTDALDRQSMIEWKNGQYDNYGRLTAYEQAATDIAGGTTQTEWKADAYADNQRLLGYTETVTDPAGLVNKIHRTNMAYDGFGNLLSYKQESTDPRGHLTTRDWQAGAYDRYNRVLAYEESVTDPLGVASRHLWRDTVYDNKNRYLSYEEETIDAFGQSGKRGWKDGKYDSYGRLTGYTQSDTDAYGNTTTKEWTGTAFDFADRVTRYEQTVTDADDNKTKTVWKAGQPGITAASFTPYNSLGQLLAFEEEVTDAYGQTNKRLWLNASYDKFGNLTDYDEVLIDPSGQALQKSWRNGGYDEYNRQVSFKETWSAVEGALDLTSPSFSLNFKTRLLQSHDWKALIIDKYGRVLGFEDAVQTPSGDIAKTTEKNATFDGQGRKYSYETESKGPDGIIYKTVRTRTDYDGRSRVSGYLETTTNDRDPGMTVKTEAAGRTFDRDGKITGGTETTTTSGVDHTGAVINAKTVRTTQDAVIQNGRAISYVQQTLTTGTGSTGETLNATESMTVSGITDFSETQTVRRTGPGMDHTVVVKRKEMVRNILGQVVGYKDSILDDATPGGETLVERSQTVYGAGGEVLGYREKTTDLYGLTHEKVTSNLLYDGLRRTLSFSETSIRQSEGKKSLPTPWTSLTVAEREEVLKDLLTDFGSTQSWADFTAEQKLAVLKGEQVVLKDNAKVQLNASDLSLSIIVILEETTDRLVTSYDALGRMNHYQEKTRSLAQGITRTTTWDATGFDAAGSVAADKTVTLVQSKSLLEKDYTLTTERLGVTYNAKAQTLSYKETAKDSRTPDLVTTREVKGIEYDSYGSIAAQDETAR